MASTVVETAQVVLQTVDQGATSGVKAAEQEMRQYDEVVLRAMQKVEALKQSMSSVGRDIPHTASTGGASGTLISPDSIRQQEQDIQHLLGLMDSIPRKMLSLREMGEMKKSLLSGHETEAEIERVGQRLDFLRTKMWMLEQASGKGWQSIRNSINSARTPEQLQAIQQEMDRLGVKAGQNATSFHNLRSVVKQWTDSLAQANPAMAAFIGGVGGGMAFQLIGNLIQNATQHLRDFIKGIRETADAQRALHVESVETGLSVESLETLKVAAAATGAEIGQLRMGMRMLAMNMEKQPEVFAALGISVKDARGHLRSLDDVLPEIMDIFSGMSNETERLALASALLGGRMGARLLPVFTQGSAAMRAFHDEGVKLGVILDHQSDQTLTEYARKAAFADLALEGLNKHIRIALVPAMETWAGAIIKTVAALRYLAEQWDKLTAPKREREDEMRRTGEQLVAADLMRTYGRKGFNTAPSAVTGQTFLSDASASAKTAAVEGTKLIDEVANEIDERVRKALESLTAGGEKNAVDKLVERFKSLSLILPDLDRVALSARDVGGALQGWAKQYGDDRALQMASYALVVRRLRGEFGTLAPVVATATREAWQGLKTTGEQAAAAEAKWRALYAPIVESWHAMESVGLQLDRLTASYRDGRIGSEEYATSLSRLNDEARRLSTFSAADIVKLPEALRSSAQMVNDSTKGLRAFIGLQAALLPVAYQPPRFDEESLRSYEKSVRRVEDDIREYRDNNASMVTYIRTVWQGIGSAMEQPIDRFMSHVFASSTGWAQFWRILADTALTQLARIEVSNIMLRFTEGLEGGGGGGLLGFIGSALAWAVSGGAVTTGGTQTQSLLRHSSGDTYVIQTFTPRDVLMDLTSPSGSLRRANETLTLVGEH